MPRIDRALPCGCRLCGCACPEHAPRGAEMPCEGHALIALAAWVLGDAAALVSVGLVLALVAAVCAIRAA